MFLSRAIRAVLLVLLLALTSCGTRSEQLRSDPRTEVKAPAAPRVVIRRHPGRPKVQVTEEQFNEAMHWLLRDVSRLQRTGRLTPRFHVVPVAGASFEQLQLALIDAYHSWCGRRHASGDCLDLQRDGPYLDAEDRYKIAFDIALGARWDGFTDELHGMADPALVRVVLLGAMVSYMALIAFPELTTKGIAAAVTVSLAAWLGVETVWNLVAGWIQMVRDVNAATTFGQLREAGERYGRTIGSQTARILVMVVTAAISEGRFVTKLLGLPGAAQSSRVLAAETGGMRLAAIGQVGAVQIAEDTLSFVLAPTDEGTQQETATQMANAGDRGGAPPPGSPPPKASRRTTDLKLRFKEGWTEEQRAAARTKVEALNEARDKVVVKAPRRAGTSASARFKAKGGQVPAGCDVDHCMDLQLNGTDTLENLWPLDSSVNRSLGAQVQQAIGDLPAGTPIGTVTIE